MKKILIIALCAAFLAGCSSMGSAPVTTIVEEAVPVQAAEELPAQATHGGYTIDELDGSADKDDFLPKHETLEEALAANPDVIGWLTVNGTAIDYPVLRTADNDFYLTHNAEGKDSKHGAIFMDFRNALPAMQQHIIIYGHNMKNGTMFHDLVNYKQRDFFHENRRIYLLWDGMDTEWEIFCAYIVEPDTIYPIQTMFADGEEFAAVMNNTVKYARTVSPSVVDDEITIQSSDQVLSLVTCTYEYDDSRYVVMARRVK